ncbi:MAG: BMP family ABC transporter substrate-binding protein [Synergistaceae bacterium]|nr:BMP family ABC transporter substrate-binding protein [Synergistota bacterium]NLM70545.1 BMP family ABC transporter substrate-binding protein [Synergistaceae bacterium]
MRKVLLGTICLAFAAGAILAGGWTVAAGADEVIKLAMIVESTVDDKGWCQSMHDGITEAQKRLPGRIDYSYSEKMKPVDAGSAVLQYVSQGYGVIIGHGAQYKNLMLEMAEEYPDVTFVFGTSAEIGPANVYTYMPESEETGYLSGVIAGMTTKNNIVGVVGPVDGGDAARYNRGYVLGVQAINPEAKVIVAHSGSFGDFVKAGEVAETQIKAGADVLTGSSQQALGALRAVADHRDEPIWWVGQETAQLGIPEGYKCIGASEYNYAAVIVDLVAKLDAGETGGECIALNFANGGFNFRFNDDLKEMWEGPIEQKIAETLEKFRSTPGTIDWSKVDYSKL